MTSSLCAGKGAAKFDGHAGQGHCLQSRQLQNPMICRPLVGDFAIIVQSFALVRPAIAANLPAADSKEIVPKGAWPRGKRMAALRRSSISSSSFWLVTLSLMPVIRFAVMNFRLFLQFVGNVSLGFAQAIAGICWPPFRATVQARPRQNFPRRAQGQAAHGKSVPHAQANIFRHVSGFFRGIILMGIDEFLGFRDIVLPAQSSVFGTQGVKPGFSGDVSSALATSIERSRKASRRAASPVRGKFASRASRGPDICRVFGIFNAAAGPRKFSCSGFPEVLCH